jgi:hypothetical protein
VYENGCEYSGGEATRPETSNGKNTGNIWNG